jgi:hypothetical protein
MSNELETVWKEVVVVCFKVLSLHVSGGIDEIHEKLHPVSRPKFEPGTS